MSLRARIFALTLFTALPLTACADSIFTFTDGKNNTIKFTLPGGQTGSACHSDPDEFCVYLTPVVTNGSSGISSEIAFYDTAEGGGLTILENGGTLLAQLGPQLFLGTMRNPIFLAGNFDLTNDPSSASAFDNDFHLTITTSAVSSTPEPSSMALFGTGLLGVIGAVRRRRAVTEMR